MKKPRRRLLPCNRLSSVQEECRAAPVSGTSAPSLWVCQGQKATENGHIQLSSSPAPPASARLSAGVFSPPAKSPRRHPGPLQPGTAAWCHDFGHRIYPPSNCKCIKIS